jgi:hypothetical protein
MRRPSRHLADVLRVVERARAFHAERRPTSFETIDRWIARQDRRFMSRPEAMTKVDGTGLDDPPDRWPECAIKRPSDHAAQAAGSSPRTYSNPQSHDYARSPALHPRPALTSTSGGFPPGSVTIPQAAADKC